MDKHLNKNELRLQQLLEAKSFDELTDMESKFVLMQITKDDRRLKSVGLMMIKQLSKQLNGEIRIEVDGGTLFELVFPIPE